VQKYTTKRHRKKSAFFYAVTDEKKCNGLNYKSNEVKDNPVDTEYAVQNLRFFLVTPMS
jgi:hypothetical protein